MYNAQFPDLLILLIQGIIILTILKTLLFLRKKTKDSENFNFFIRVFLAFLIILTIYSTFNINSPNGYFYLFITTSCIFLGIPIFFEFTGRE